MPINDAVAIRVQAKNQKNAGKAKGIQERLLERLGITDPLAEIEAEFKRISEEGIFSEEDIQKLRQRMTQLSNFRRKQASRGLRQNLRLGPRSGAAEGFIQNRLAGPEFLAEAQREEQLFGANVQSRFAGLQGSFDVQQYRDALKRQRQQDKAGGGFLGLAKSLAPIALSFINPPGGAAVGAGTQLANRGGFQRGQPFGQNANFSPYYNTF